MSIAVSWRSAPTRLLDLRSRWLHRPEREWAGEVAPGLVAATIADGSGWQTDTVEFTSTFVAVVMVGCADSARRFVVKVPWTANGAEKLRRQAEVLEALHLDTRLRSLHPLIPRRVAQGEIDGRYYCVEEALPGVPASTMMSRRAARPAVLSAACHTIGELHRSTREDTLLDSATVDAWAHTPLRRLEAYAAGHRRRELLNGAIRRLRSELDDVLTGRTVHTSWIHGDFWHGNLLTSGLGSEVTGVVDWDGAAARQLPLHDLLHLHVFVHRLTYGDELGDIVIKAMNDGIADTIGVPSSQVMTWLDGIPERSAVLLYWLRHLLLFIDTEGHHDNQRWLRTNVESVLANA